MNETTIIEGTSNEGINDEEICSQESNGKEPSIMWNKRWKTNSEKIGDEETCCKETNGEWPMEKEATLKVSGEGTYREKR